MFPKPGIYIGDYDFLRFSRSQRYFTTGIVGNALTSGITNYNLLMAQFFSTPVNFSFDRIAFNVTTAGAAGTKGRVGIYEDDNTIYPGVLILDGGEFAVDSTGVKETTINPAMTLQRGKIFWLAFLSSGSPTIRLVSASSIISAIHGNNSSLSILFQSGYEISQSYGALPTPYPAGAGCSTSMTGYLAVFLRKV